jgi:tRNA pseudouridine55 synthase
MYGNQVQVRTLDGAILVDKPEGWTSHDVVNRMRRLAQTKKIGHLGTLDPIATGLLPLVIGRATRLAQFFTRNDKVYEAVVRFGFATDTYDRAGTPLSEERPVTLDREELDRRLDRFRGCFLQTPPPISAKKVGGVPAYRLARKKIEVVLEPVEVEVFELTLAEIEGNEARLRVHCAAGTYVRSIAHELGQAIGCGAHLKDLRRTASGDFTIGEAHTMKDLEAASSEERLDEVLIPAASLIPQFPMQYVDEVTEAHIRQGRDFAVSPFRAQRDARYVKAVSRSGELIAIGEMKLPNVCHPVVVL